MSVTEGPTKTRKGSFKKCTHPLTQKLLKTGDPRSPVMFFEKLLSKRPPRLQLSGPLYFTPLCNNNWAEEECGFLVDLWVLVT